MTELSLLNRKIERERAARQAAERLLEEKSRELFEANERLSISAARSSAISDSVRDLIIVFKKDGVIEEMNPAARKFFGPKDATENFTYLLDAPHDRDFVVSLASFVENKSRELVDDSPREVSCSGHRPEVPFALSIGEADWGSETVFVAVLHDLSRRKAQEAESRELERELAQAQKLESMGRLAGGIAHEINTPIQFIGDNLKFVDDSLKELWGTLAAYRSARNTSELTSAHENAGSSDLEFLNEELPEAIQQSLDGVEQVGRIVLAMRDFAHPAGQDKEALNLNRAIETTATISRNEWKNVATLELDLDPDLPIVSGHLGELNQVLLNLVVNSAHAIEASSSNERIGTINISTRATESVTEISIRDSGIGMSQDTVSKIFEPFFTTKEVGKGTGQGLSIVHDIIVHKHGGSIDVESEEGVGTTFKIQLPLEVTTADEVRMAG